MIFSTNVARALDFPPAPPPFLFFHIYAPLFYFWILFFWLFLRLLPLYFLLGFPFSLVLVKYISSKIYMLLFYLIAFNMFNTISWDFILFCGIFIFCAGFYFCFFIYTYIATLWILYFLFLRFFIFF